MSKTLFAAAVAIAGTVRSQFSDEQAFLKESFDNISKLSDKDWDAMEEQVQDWYNACCEALEKKAALPTLGAPEEGGPKRRRAPGGDGAAAAPAGGGGTINVDAVTAGMRVCLKTARMEVTGEVTDVGKNTIKVKQDDGTEKPVATRRIKEAVNLAAPSGGGAAAAPAGGAGGAAVSVDSLGEGMNVTIKTARKEVSGTVKSIGKSTIVLVNAEGAEEKVAVRRVTEVIDNSGGGGAAGVGVGANPEEVTAVRQACVDDMEASAEDIQAVVESEDGIALDQSVVDVIYADTHAVIGMLREAELLAE